MCFLHDLRLDSFYAMLDNMIYENNKRFYSHNQYLRDTFGEKTFKIALDAGFTCPNRDGTVGVGGCSFCTPAGSGDFVVKSADSILEQFYSFQKMMHQKWAKGKYIAYFQAFSGTYAPVSALKERFEPMLNVPDVVGISIATRPDCLPLDVLDYLADLNKRTYLWVELGLQTIHDETADKFGRGYDYRVFLQALENLRARGISVCVHIINGLPGENTAMMMEGARALSQLDIQGVKIHLLHLLRGTKMAEEYAKGAFSLMEMRNYVNLVCDQIEMLPENVVIHRLSGDGKRDSLIGPMWSLKKWELLNAIDNTMAARDSWQGKYYVTSKNEVGDSI